MQKTNWLYIVFLVALTVWVVLFIRSKTNGLEINVPVVKIEKNNDLSVNNNLKTGKIGDLEFQYPENFIIEDISEDKTNINFKTISISNNTSIQKNIIGNIFYTKNGNKDNLTIENWWDKLGPQNAKQAPYPDSFKNIKINGIDAYETMLAGFTVSNEDFDTHDLYFTYNKDIYIFSYNQKQNEDNNNVNQILSSFKFVE